MAPDRAVGAMSTNPNFWHLVSVLIIALSATWGFTNTISNRMAIVEQKVEVIGHQYDNVSGMIHEMQLDIRQILQKLENKQNRPGTE